jgi:putative ABC transport system permease protein
VVLPPRVRKIFRDLGTNYSRTLLVVASIAVGILAIAATLGGRQVLLREFDRDFAQSQRADITYTVSDCSPQVVRRITARPQVASAVGVRIFDASYMVVPDDMDDATALRELSDAGGDTVSLSIAALDAADFDSAEVSHLNRLDTQVWPPGSDDIIIEASATQEYPLAVGDRLLVDTGSGKRVMRISGFVHDINAIPTMFFEEVTAYVSRDALAGLGQADAINTIRVNTTGSRTRAQNARIADAIQDQVLDAQGITVTRMEVPEPDYHFFGNLFAAVSVLLLVMAFMALALSGFLVVTTVSAILVQQTKQIGIMKAVGARRGQIAGLYLGLVLCYGALAVIIGYPVGIGFGNWFIDYAGGILNFQISDYTFPFWVTATLFGVGLLLPALAALIPIIQGIRRPIVDAFNPEVAGVTFGGGVIDRLLGRIRMLPRPTALALRSTFAHKGRLIMTLITLMLASATVMAVFSVGTSLNRTVDNVGGWWRYDAQVILTRVASQRELERLAGGISGVEYAETWLDGRVTIQRPDGTKNDSFWTIGIPGDTHIMHFEFVEGRAPAAGEEAVLVTTDLASAEDFLQVGSTVTLTVNGQDVQRPVVGIVTGSLQGATLYMERDDLANLSGVPGNATRVLVQGTDGAVRRDTLAEIKQRTDLQTRLARQLETRLEDKHIPVSSTQTAVEQLELTGSQLGILTTILTIMSAALGLVGIIGLSGSMTLSVIENTREIGIMRSVGAGHASIFGIYITQGLVVGTLSWAAGAVLSWPLSWGLMQALITSLDMKLAYSYSTSGVFFTLGIVWLISVVGSLLPAWRAAQVSIRDAISYE